MVRHVLPDSLRNAQQSNIFEYQRPSTRKCPYTRTRATSARVCCCAPGLGAPELCLHPRAADRRHYAGAALPGEGGHTAAALEPVRPCGQPRASACEHGQGTPGGHRQRCKGRRESPRGGCRAGRDGVRLRLPHVRLWPSTLPLRAGPQVGAHGTGPRIPPVDEQVGQGGRARRAAPLKAGTVPVIRRGACAGPFWADPVARAAPACCLRAGSPFRAAQGSCRAHRPLLPLQVVAMRLSTPGLGSLTLSETEEPELFRCGTGLRGRVPSLVPHGGASVEHRLRTRAGNRKNAAVQPEGSGWASAGAGSRKHEGVQRVLVREALALPRSRPSSLAPPPAPAAPQAGARGPGCSGRDDAGELRSQTTAARSVA